MRGRPKQGSALGLCVVIRETLSLLKFSKLSAAQGTDRKTGCFLALFGQSFCSWPSLKLCAPHLTTSVHFFLQ